MFPAETLELQNGFVYPFSSKAETEHQEILDIYKSFILGDIFLRY